MALASDTVTPLFSDIDGVGGGAVVVPDEALARATRKHLVA